MEACLFLHKKVHKKLKMKGLRKEPRKPPSKRLGNSQSTGKRLRGKEEMAERNE